VLREAEPDALRVLQALLPRQPKAPAGFKARVAPNGWHVQTIAQALGHAGLREVLAVFMEQLELDDAHFEVAGLQQMLAVAEHLDRRAGALTLRDRFVYAQAPVDPDAPLQLDAFLGWAARHAHEGRAGEPLFVEEVDGRSRLDRMEQALRLASLWLWLDLRFPGVYGAVDAVTDFRDTLNDGIERQLKSRRPLWEQRRSGGARGLRSGRR
jgi:ATP-dependent RNA helicase SUPV3L1/SUV3